MVGGPMNNLACKFMSFFFNFRDFSPSPIKIIEQIGTGPGWNEIDYGCGSGSYSILTAQLVGPREKSTHRQSYLSFELNLRK
jgi:ubiquinone/menaquinone biosynthesis C-methylase UbiE